MNAVIFEVTVQQHEVGSARDDIRASKVGVWRCVPTITVIADDSPAAERSSARI